MLAFVHIEKCGGTTLIHVLRRCFMLDHFDVIPREKTSMVFDQQDLQLLLRLRPGVKSIAGHPVRLWSRLEEVVPGIRYVTLLRDPIARYVSDFRHFVDYVGYPNDFQRWLTRRERFNFQTRAIAGSENLDLAKQLLATRFAMVGLVERYDEFMRALSVLIGCHPDVLKYEIKNTASKRRCSPTAGLDVEQCTAQIVERNRLDLELYQYARQCVVPRLKAQLAAASPCAASGRARWRHGGLAGRLRVAANRAYRNLVYKPWVGRLPGPHVLPLYRPRRRRAA